MTKVPDNDKLIEQLIKEAEEENSPQLKNSRLAAPLNTAYRYVASSIAIISTLDPQQRKEAAVKLVDISEAAFRAIEKTLKRSVLDENSSESNLLQQVTSLIKKLEVFDSNLSSLKVQESLDFSSETDSENQWGHDENGLPEPLTVDTVVDVVEPIAVRFLKNNADVPAEAGEGDPAEEEDQPIKGSEATDQTIDDTAENNLISTLAAETDKSQEGEKLPPQFKELSSTDEAKIRGIHEQPSHNLQLLDLLMNGNI